MSKFFGLLWVRAFRVYFLGKRGVHHKNCDDRNFGECVPECPKAIWRGYQSYAFYKKMRSKVGDLAGYASANATTCKERQIALELFELAGKCAKGEEDNES